MENHIDQLCESFSFLNRDQMLVIYRAQQTANYEEFRRRALKRGWNPDEQDKVIKYDAQIPLKGI